MAGDVREQSRESLQQQRSGEVFAAVEALNRAVRQAAEAGLQVEVEEVPVQVIALPPHPHLRARCWVEVVGVR